MYYKTTSNTKKPNHILYSRGYLLDSPELDHENALSMLTTVINRSEEQIKERLLAGERKKIKSSDSLKKLIALQQTLVNCGLDAYIKLDAQNI